MFLEKESIIETSLIINKVKEIQAVLAQSSPPCCYVSKKHIGMTFKEFLYKYQGLKVHYTSPYRGSFEIEIRSDNATTTCHMVDNVCVEAYIFYDDDFAFLLPKFPFDTKPN